MQRLSSLPKKNRIVITCSLLAVIFMAVTVGAYFLLLPGEDFTGTAAQQTFYALGASLLTAGLVAGLCWMLMTGAGQAKHNVWFCPLAAAGLSLAIFAVAYAYLGVWPLGTKTVMIVDMHHQYAPLLNELRDMFLHGGNFGYSFHVGLGTNFAPLFAYYLASPLNLLLILFPERLLAEAILLITLLKNALAAALFAACIQYITRRRNAGTVAVAVMYSLTMYMLAYSWNIMWLDVVALLPATVMSLEYMLRRHKPLPYILTLALALFVNYYIGFMLCVFLVLYFIVWSVRQKRKLKPWLTGGGYFAVGSLLGGGLAAFLLIPTALALSATSAAGGEMPEFMANFPLFDLLGRFFWGGSPTIRSGNLPNLYCGLLAVLLLPVYAMRKDIPVRRRITYIALLAVMALSCSINQIDLLWHGMHAPNDLPYRFSFLACFALLLIAGRTLADIKKIAPRQIILSLCGCAAYLILWEKLDTAGNLGDDTLYINLTFLAVYALILWLGARGTFTRRSAAMALLIPVTLELILGSSAALVAMNKNEYFTAHSGYVDNESTEATRNAVRRAQELAKEEADTFGAFSRTEFLPRDTCMDTAMYHYNGITTFASSNSYAATMFMGSMGYACNGVNSYLYNATVPLIDSLLGIRYIVRDTPAATDAALTLMDTLATGGQTRYIYRNDLALPIGYYATGDVRYFESVENDPLHSQEQFLSAVTGGGDPIYTFLPLTPDTEEDTIENSGFYKHGSDDASFSAYADEAGNYYAFAECRASEDISFTLFDENGDIGNTWYGSASEPYVIDLGYLEAGQQVQVTVSGDGAMIGNIYVVRQNGVQLRSTLAGVAAHGVQVTSFSPTHITGTVNAPGAGAVMFSIPYDTGWTVKIDGKATDIFAVDAGEEGKGGALLAANVGRGDHTVELTYVAPGQTAGWLISIVSLCLILLPTLLRLIRRRRTATPGK